jgi:hypothetical protein
VLEARNRVQGLEHPDTLMTLNSLTYLLQQRGKLDEAEPLARRLLEVRRRVLGPGHPDTLIAMNNLAVLLRSRGNRVEAESIIRACLEARRRVLAVLYRVRGSGRHNPLRRLSLFLTICIH